MTRSIGTRPSGATHRSTLRTLLLNDLTLQIFDFVVDTFGCSNFTLDFIDKFLDLLLLNVDRFLRHALLFLLLRVLRLLHLKIFKKLIVFEL